MRILPNIVGLFLLVVGSAWAFAGTGYLRDAAMTGSYIWTAFGLLAAIFGLVILVSINRARFRLWRFKRGRAN
jgi:hypothetical protein